jgi:hypothetical protein
MLPHAMASQQQQQTVRKSAQNRFAKTQLGRCAAVKVRKMGLVLGAYKNLIVYL